MNYVKSTLGVKLVLALSVPMLAHAAEQKIHQLDSMSDIGMWTWFFILLFSTLGWGVKDLDKLADWWSEGVQEVRAQMRIRLGILKGIFGSNAAGICTYLLGNVAPDWLGMKNPVPEMALFVLIALAGFWGARWFDALGQKFFGSSSSYPPSGSSYPPDSGPPVPPGTPKGPYSKDD